MIKTMDADGTGAVPMDPRLEYKTGYGEVDAFHGLICQVFDGRCTFTYVAETPMIM